MTALERWLASDRRMSGSAIHGTLDVSPFSCGHGGCPGGDQCRAAWFNEAAAEVWAEHELSPHRTWVDACLYECGYPVEPMTLSDAMDVVREMERSR